MYISIIIMDAAYGMFKSRFASYIFLCLSVSLSHTHTLFKMMQMEQTNEMHM